MAREKAGASWPFSFRQRVGVCCDEVRQNNFCRARNFHRACAIMFAVGAGGQTNMRAFALGLILSAFTVPCFAQTVLKSEPLVLAPYEIAFVQDSSCGAGRVLKVTGAIRGLHRKKVCVAVGSAQASLVSATP
jgi:hypothetical protein